MGFSGIEKVGGLEAKKRDGARGVGGVPLMGVIRDDPSRIAMKAAWHIDGEDEALALIEAFDGEGGYRTKGTCETDTE